MNADVKAKWVTALKSGDYKQTTGALKNLQGFCCLGVLCDLYMNEKGGKWEDQDTIGISCDSFMGHATNLPKLVAEWAELSSTFGEQVTIQEKVAFLHDQNDSGNTFEAIAEAIEKQL